MRRPLAIMIAAVVLAGCGTSSPTRPSKSSSRLQNAAQPLPVGGAQPGGMAGVPGAQDPRVAQIIGAVNKMREASTGADIRIRVDYWKDDGTKAYVTSHYKFQKPKRNYIEIIKASDTKAEGTRIVWTGGEKATVKTKFLGPFWVTLPVDVHDDRMKDQRGYFIDETAIDRSLLTLCDPRNQYTYNGEGNLKGKPMTLLGVVSPLSLKPTTREVFGIDPQTSQPILREMYKGTKLIWRMTVESAVVNPSLSSKDFQVE